MVAEKRGAAAGQEKYERWRNIPGWLVVTCENNDDAVRAREDYAATCKALASHGVDAIQTGAEVGQIFVSDPDGNVIELIQPGGQLGRR